MSDESLDALDRDPVFVDVRAARPAPPPRFVEDVLTSLRDASTSHAIPALADDSARPRRRVWLAVTASALCAAAVVLVIGVRRPGRDNPSRAGAPSVPRPAVAMIDASLPPPVMGMTGLRDELFRRVGERMSAGGCGDPATMLDTFGLRRGNDGKVRVTFTPRAGDARNCMAKAIAQTEAPEVPALGSVVVAVEFDANAAPIANADASWEDPVATFQAHVTKHEGQFLRCVPNLDPMHVIFRRQPTDVMIEIVGSRPHLTPCFRGVVQRQPLQPFPNYLRHIELVANQHYGFFRNCTSCHTQTFVPAQLAKKHPDGVTEPCVNCHIKPKP